MSNRATRRAAMRQANKAAQPTETMLAEQAQTGRPETISEAQLAANRANAQSSTGPKSEQGKLISSQNALKTGLTGRTIILPKDAAAYQALVALINQKFNPANDIEKHLTQTMADTECVSSASPLSNPVSTPSAVSNSPPTAPTNPTPNSAPPCSRPTSSAPIKRTSAISLYRNAVSAINSDRTPPNSAACNKNASNKKPQRNRARQQAPPHLSNRKMASNFQLLPLPLFRHRR